MKLYPFQEETVDFLLDGSPHKLLCDDPGVGKTPPVCVALGKIPKRWNRTLIICPTAIKETWEHRLKEWSAILTKGDAYVIYTGEPHELEGFPYIIVSPELLLRESVRKELLVLKYDCIVVDEAHRFKAFDGEGANFLYTKLLPLARYKWLLSGTIMTNRPVELFLPLKVLFNDEIAPYNTYAKFTQRYCNGYYDGEGWNATGSSNLEELREKLHKVMLRRELREVYPELPDVIEEEIFIPIDIEESERNTSLPVLERLVGIAKIKAVVDWIKEVGVRNDKLLVFTRNRAVTEGIHAGLIEAGIKATKYYGGMSAADKMIALDWFKGEQQAVLVANRVSLGEATDGLQHVCNHIVEAQFDWSRGLTDQGYGRLVRNGQTQKVRITRMIASNTIEETILWNYRQKAKTNTILFGTRKEKNMTVDDHLTLFIANTTRIATALEKIAANGHVEAPKPTPSIRPDTVIGATAKPAAAVVAKPAKSAPVKSAKKEVEIEDEPTEVDAEGGVTIEDVRAVAGEIREKLGGKAVPSAKAAIDKITKKFGGTKLADIDSKKYPEFIEALKALAPEDDGDDEETEEDEDM